MTNKNLSSFKCSHIELVNYELLRKQLKEYDIKYLSTCVKCEQKIKNLSQIINELEIWICLGCLVASCGKNINSHAYSHYRTLSKVSEFHCLFIGVNKHIYCFKCDLDIAGTIAKYNENQANFIKTIQELFWKINMKDQSMTTKKRSLLGSFINCDENENKVISIKFKSLALTEVYSDQRKRRKKFFCIKGLMNFGNSCFFNTIMQCLNSTPLIIKGCLQPIDNEFANQPFFNNLRNFIKKIRDSIGPTYNLKQTFENTLCKLNPKFSSLKQQDSHEALVTLFQGLVEEHISYLKSKLNRKINIEESFIGSIFSSKLINKTYCLSCKQNFVVIDDILDLSLAIEENHEKILFQIDEKENLHLQKKYIADVWGTKDFMYPYKKENLHLNNYKSPSKIVTINDALNFFFDKEVLGETENMFYCNNCKKNVPLAVREYYLSIPPKVLVLHLKRFTGSSYMIQKLSKKIEIQETIFLDDYVCFEKSEIEFLSPHFQKYIFQANLEEKHLGIFQYNLFGVCVHTGNMYNGHYICYIKNFNDDKWFYISDNYTHEVNKNVVLKSEAYLLFYTKDST